MVSYKGKYDRMIRNISYHTIKNILYLRLWDNTFIYLRYFISYRVKEWEFFFKLLASRILFGKNRSITKTPQVWYLHTYGVAGRLWQQQVITKPTQIESRGHGTNRHNTFTLVTMIRHIFLISHQCGVFFGIFEILDWKSPPPVIKLPYR